MTAHFTSDLLLGAVCLCTPPFYDGQLILSDHHVIGCVIYTCSDTCDSFYVESTWAKHFVIIMDCKANEFNCTEETCSVSLNALKTISFSYVQFSMSLPVMRFLILLGAGFSEKYHVSPHFIIIGTLFQCCILGQGA